MEVEVLPHFHFAGKYDHRPYRLDESESESDSLSIACPTSYMSKHAASNSHLVKYRGLGQARHEESKREEIKSSRVIPSKGHGESYIWSHCWWFRGRSKCEQMPTATREERAFRQFHGINGHVNEIKECLAENGPYC